MLAGLAWVAKYRAPDALCICLKDGGQSPGRTQSSWATLFTLGTDASSRLEPVTTQHPPAPCQPRLETASELGLPLGRMPHPVTASHVYGVLLLASQVRVTHSRVIKLNTPFCTSRPQAFPGLLHTRLSLQGWNYSNVMKGRKGVIFWAQSEPPDWPCGGPSLHLSLRASLPLQAPLLPPKPPPPLQTT